MKLVKVFFEEGFSLDIHDETGQRLINDGVGVSARGTNFDKYITYLCKIDIKKAHFAEMLYSNSVTDIECLLEFESLSDLKNKFPEYCI